MSGQPCHSSFRTTAYQERWVALFRYSNTAIASVKSTLCTPQDYVNSKQFGRDAEAIPGANILGLWSYHGTPPVIPDSFLGGSAPRLRNFSLNTVLFPHLPELLLSTAHLVGRFLWNFPHSGYSSPEAMVTVLSALTSLESLHLQFPSHQSCPDQATQHLPSPTRSSLLVLTELRFKGVSKYVEDLAARIVFLQLRTLDITFF